MPKKQVKKRVAKKVKRTTKQAVAPKKEPRNVSFLVKILCFVIIVFLAFIVFSSVFTKGQVVEEGMTVSVHYEGRLETGESFDTSYDKEPLKFVVGDGRLVTGFENAVLGMKVGEKKTATLLPEDAYGAHNEEMLQEIPLENIPPGVQVGDTLALRSQDGEMPDVPVVVIEVTETSVILDMNHPLAGKTLIFDIEVVEIVE